MKRLMSLLLCTLFFILIIPEVSFSQAPVPYDDFSGSFIDPDKWGSWEFVGEIQNGKLVSKTTAYGSNVFNNLKFKNPDLINYIEADVMIQEIEGDLGSTGVDKYSFPFAELAGFFYNDGSTNGPGSYKGEVSAVIQIGSYNGSLWVYCDVLKRTNDQGTNWDRLYRTWFSNPITSNEAYKLSIQFEPNSKKFTFKFGDNIITWTSLDTINPSNIPWKAIQTGVGFVGDNTENLYGKISASFDNVIVKDDLGNIVMSDDFSSPTLDGTKWASNELVREISDGKLRSMISGNSVILHRDENWLFFNDPSSIQTIQAKVSPQAYLSPQGGAAFAGISGLYYNDGAPDSSVGAGVYIGGMDGSDPIGTWVVARFTDLTNPAGYTTELIASGNFSTPILLENTYTISLKWDGSQFTLKFDHEEANYVPLTTINPSAYVNRQIGTIMRNPAGMEATIDVLFDDVAILEFGTSITLQSPAYGTAFDSCSLINTHQPTFSWTSSETFNQFTIFFSSTDFTTPGISIAKGNVQGSINSWIPAIGLWKKMMTWSNTNGMIYWKVVGTRPDKSTVESDVWSFRIGLPQEVTINSPVDGETLPFNLPPTFDININCNVKFRLEFSPFNDFSDPQKIKGFAFTVKDPVAQPTLLKTLTTGQWTAMKKLLTPTGYFRIKAWDGMKRETISEVRSFNVQSMLIGSWDVGANVSVTVTLEGYRSWKVREHGYDFFTFNEDGSFEMIDMEGTWTEQGTNFTINLPWPDLEDYFETGLEYALEQILGESVYVDLTIIALSFTGTETWTGAGGIKGSLNLDATIDVYTSSTNIHGTIKAIINFKGTQSLQGLSLSTLRASPIESSQSLIRAIGGGINNAIKDIKEPEE